MPQAMPEHETLLNRSEVAERFRVSPLTVTRWARAGKITAIRTPGNQRRYSGSEVAALLKGDGADAA